MLKPFFKTLSVASALLFASHSVAGTFSVSPASINIRPGQDYDAVINKHIYRSLEIKKSKDDSIAISFESKTGLSSVEVTALSNSCSNAEDTCQIMLDIVSSSENFEGILKFKNAKTQEEIASPFVIHGNLEYLDFNYFNFEEAGELGPYPKVSVLKCDDLSVLNDNEVARCQSYRAFLQGEFTESGYVYISENDCKKEENPIERSKCEGLKKGLLLSNCENLDPVGTQSCSRFHKAAVKNCDEKDFDCKAMEKMLHGYLNCSDMHYGDLLAVCTAYQSAYLKGISSKWVTNHFLPFAKANSKHLSLENNSPYLAYIAPTRFELLEIEKEDREFLINAFPTMMRSVFLNSPNFKFGGSFYLWKQIESHLDPKQTVGFELECPAVKLDITSGFNKSAVLRKFSYGDAYLSSDLISPEETERKELKVDSEFKKSKSDMLFFLKYYGVWHEEKEWPYFNTYGMKLFETMSHEMNLPLVSATLESRFGSAHFPHVELVTAPLSLETKPLNLRNTRAYLKNIVYQSCSNEYSQSVKHTEIYDWKNHVELLPVSEEEIPLDYDLTEEPALLKTPMICMSNILNECHVQSNVGVFLDQMFTDAFLVQTLGHNGPYRSDEVYNASWHISKRLFSFLQWAHNYDKLVDKRNHAAGLFTYMINDLYLRSVLYAGGFSYWKGTLSHIMKFEIRRVMESLTPLERGYFKMVTLNLWHMDGLPKEFTDLTKSVLSDFIYKTDWNNLKIPSGETPQYNEDFAAKVEGIFKEMLWTIVLSNEDEYTKSLSNYWGTVVGKSTDLSFYDAETNAKRDRAGFIHGISDYSTHCGGQCDVGKRIRPVTTTFTVGDKEFERMYTVVETRYGNADFNQAVFWRCHENNRDKDHYCPY